ncbi:MAG: hypothetical protein K6E71_07745 [Lachnospiraceae bacterium]|nr:hypothetical protein [Lachnospiraceae bacterium]
MEKFIFTYVDEDKEGIFRDLTSEEASTTLDYLPSHKRFTNYLLDKAEKLCLSYQLNSRVQLPFTSVFCNFEGYAYDPQMTYHMIIPTTSISKLTVKYLSAFRRRHPNVKLYALVTDSMHASSPHMNLVRKKLFSDVWEKVLTYDKYDAEEYGFTWFGLTYYSSFDFVDSDSIKSDIYYVGYDKGGREQTILDVYKKIRREGGNARFDVVSDKPVDAESGLEYLKRRISYPEVVGRVKASNCILEVLQKNQLAQSLRYFEAIVYNKKLLTNNPHITELPYYDARYMRVFCSLDDIDVEWVKRREGIDYGYSGEFSPLGLVTFIKELGKTTKG